MAGLSPRERRARALRAIREARKRRGLQKDEHVERVIGSLAQLQQQILDTLEGQPSDFDQGRLEELLREVDAHTERWTRRGKGEITAAIEGAWELGPQLVDAPFEALGTSLPRTLLPGSLLEELVAEGVEFMDDLGPVARRRLREHLETTLLGGKTPHEAMVEIGADLGGPGPLRMVSFRAETVVRTEMGRVHSKAADRRHVDAAKHVPGLGKEWWWSGKGRTAHAEAHGQVRPVGEPFEVGGERLMYPRDPSASPENTINCGCESLPHMEQW